MEEKEYTIDDIKQLEEVFQASYINFFVVHQSIDNIKNTWISADRIYGDSFKRSTIYLTNIADTVIKKYVELCNNFYKNGISPFGSVSEDKHYIPNSLINISVEDLMSKVSEASILLGDYTTRLNNLITETDVKITERNKTIVEYNRKVTNLNKSALGRKYISFRLFLLNTLNISFLDDMPERITISREDSNLLKRYLDEYENYVKKCQEYSIKDNIEEAYKEHLLKSVGSDSTKSVNDIYSDHIHDLKDSIIPDLEKMGLSSLVPQLEKVFLECYDIHKGFDHVVDDEFVSNFHKQLSKPRQRKYTSYLSPSEVESIRADVFKKMYEDKQNKTGFFAPNEEALVKSGEKEIKKMDTEKLDKEIEELKKLLETVDDEKTRRICYKLIATAEKMKKMDSIIYEHEKRAEQLHNLIENYNNRNSQETENQTKK